MKNSVFVKAIVNVLGVILLAVILSRFTFFVMTTLSFFSPTDRYLDFESSDFYQLVADSRNERNLDTNMVIVPIDGLSRQEVLTVLEDVYSASPSVVGLDIFFLYPSDNDTSLNDFIQSHSNLILPMALEFYDDCCEILPAYLYDSLSVERRGVVNFNVAHSYNAVRDFVFKYNLDGIEVYNFASRIVEVSHPDAFERLEKKVAQKGGLSVDIDYPSRDYTYVFPNEILSCSDQLKNKIVLVGDFVNPQDHHVTPVGESYPGVLIHANTISTIINGDYHTRLPMWGQLLLAIILCLIYVVIKTLVNYSGGASGMLMRIVQFVLLFLIIVIGTQLYVRHKIILDLAIPLMTVALVQLAMDFWAGFLTLFSFVANKVRVISSRKAKRK